MDSVFFGKIGSSIFAAGFPARKLFFLLQAGFSFGKIRLWCGDVAGFAVLGKNNGAKLKIRRLLASGLALMLVFAAGGCGDDTWTGKDAEVTTIGIDAKGRVTEVIVEDFQQSYYSVDGLRDSFEEMIADYLDDIGASGEKTPPVVLEEIEEKNGKIRTRTTYETTEDYGDFTLESLYYGTVRQAKFYGYEVPATLIAAEGGVYTVSEGNGNNHVVFCESRTHVVTPDRILAATAGVKLVSDREADLTRTNGVAVLLLTK